LRSFEAVGDGIIHSVEILGDPNLSTQATRTAGWPRRTIFGHIARSKPDSPEAPAEM